MPANLQLNRSPKILYIGNKLSATGSTPTSIETLGPKLESEGYTLHYAGNTRNQLFRLMEMLWSILKNRKADVVLIDTYSTRAFYFAWMSGMLAVLLKAKYIPILHGGALPRRFFGSPRLCRQLFGKSYTNVAVSPYLQQSLQQHAYANVLIPNSIDIDQYTYKERHIFTPKLLWVRAFHKTYNPQMAVRLLKILSQHHPDASLTMIGPEKDGSMKECMQLAIDLRVQDKISFTGKLEKTDWHTLAASHDIFINTSRFDNMPVSIIEAMALGLPVVTTNVGGLSYLVENGVDGILVQQNNEASMLEAINTAIQNSFATTQVTKLARKKAESLDWKIVRLQWKNLLDNLVNEPADN
jgi:glycosyltransferase involved in cell wall biosynthesis